MATLVRTALVGGVGIAIGVALSVAATRNLAVQGSRQETKRTADGKPDLDGIWQALSTANWDLEDHSAQAQPGPWLRVGAMGAIPPGQGVVEGNDIPYRPEAAATKKANFENRMTPATADIEAKCYQPGVPRATYLPYPFQIIQGTSKIAMVYGYADASRTIHMDKAHPEPAPVDSWMGRSHGHWDGDTLVVDVAGLNGQAWLDRAGNFVSENARITERYTPIDHDHLMYEAAIEDPTVFTRPWKISLPLYRRLEKNVQVLEFKCIEFSEEMLYGHLRSPKSE